MSDTSGLTYHEIEIRELETNEEVEAATQLIQLCLDNFTESREGASHYYNHGDNNLLLRLEAAVRVLRDSNSKHCIAYHNWKDTVDENIKNIRESQKEEQARFTAAQRSAHAAVAKAVKDGRLVRPDVCVECGNECTPVAHHDNYKYPLSVRWMCTPCHRQHHAQNGSAPA